MSGPTDGAAGPVRIRPARTADVAGIRALVERYAQERILLGKEKVTLYESVQEFRVAELDGRLVGCGALHVMWDDLAEVRSLAVAPEVRGHGVGSSLLRELVRTGGELGVSKVFCLTFEVEFFAAHGFEVIEGAPVEPAVFSELLRSMDEGVAEFLDLERVKPNTLGNSRMLLRLIAR